MHQHGPGGQCANWAQGANWALLANSSLCTHWALLAYRSLCTHWALLADDVRRGIVSGGVGAIDGAGIIAGLFLGPLGSNPTRICLGSHFGSAGSQHNTSAGVNERPAQLHQTWLR